MANPIVVDLRNVLDLDAVVRAGISYHGVGRSTPSMIENEEDRDTDQLVVRGLGFGSEANMALGWQTK